MPHQIIEYSANLAQVFDIPTLINKLHDCAAAQAALPLAGLRTRAYAANDYRIADGHPDNAFIAVYLRIGQGRTEAVRKALGEALYQCLCAATQSLAERSPLALSYEVQEIDPNARWNKNNLRDYLRERGI